MVPNTLQLASTEESAEARLIVEAAEPHAVTAANQNWCDLFGYKAAELVPQGRRFNVFRGHETESSCYYSLTQAMQVS